MSTEFDQAAERLCSVGRDLHARGWVPATSGNFSIRLANGDIAITASGRDKSSLSPADILKVDARGHSLGGGQPSAETGLHLQLYRRDPDIGSVLHTHSLMAALVSSSAGPVELTDLELLKAFPGIQTHRETLTLPVFDNDQDIERLAMEVESAMKKSGQGHAYLIRGHGAYTWGIDPSQCLMQLEALEYLLRYYWFRQSSSEHSDP
jgi:methylthioribulose-1-phosphate dehydratase